MAALYIIRNFWGHSLYKSQNIFLCLLNLRNSTLTENPHDIIKMFWLQIQNMIFPNFSLPFPYKVQILDLNKGAAFKQLLKMYFSIGSWENDRRLLKAWTKSLSKGYLLWHNY